jgi:micrococcal nuclease
MKRWISIALAISLLAMSCDRSVRPNPPNPNDDEGITYRIVDVIDGDTVRLDDGQTIRLVGIDTPEMNHGGTPEPCAVEAKEYTRSNALYRYCYLIYNTSVGDSIDYYGRTLAFVHILPDSLCLNVEIVRAGWSEDWDSYPVRWDYEVLFEAAETEAIAAGRGIWNISANCE